MEGVPEYGFTEAVPYSAKAAVDGESDAGGVGINNSFDAEAASPVRSKRERICFFMTSGVEELECEFFCLCRGAVRHGYLIFSRWI